MKTREEIANKIRLIADDINELNKEEWNISFETSWLSGYIEALEWVLKD